MLIELDEQLQIQRKEGLEELSRYYGGGQKVQVDEGGEVIARIIRPDVTRRLIPITKRPIPIRVRR
ncbi:hypothetical protein ES705_22254 [subsurface metagenome]